MELYSMPQLDKSSYSDIHYVERSNLPSTSIPVDVKKFSPVSGDILTSSAWSAVIHQPAEDSEPEDLPSTVDMDAIKGSPTTSLPTSGPMGWSEGDRGQGGGVGGDDESDSGDDDDDEEDEDDDENEKEESSSDNESSSPNTDGDDADSESGTAQGSASDSDSESSSKNSFDSDSDSASSDSSCSSRSSASSHSSPSPTPTREPEKHLSSQGQQHSAVLKPRVGAHRFEKHDEHVGRPEAKTEDDKPHRKDDRSEPKKESARVSNRSKAEPDEDRPKEGPVKPSPLRTFRRKDPEGQASRGASKAKGSSSEVSSSRPSSSSAAGGSLKDLKSAEEKKSDRKVTTIASSTTQTSTSAASSAANDSSSDMELPDQVVNDAIERIQVEPKSKLATRAADVEEEEEDDIEEEDESSEDENRRRAHYSSSLLQKFVENTERISGKRNSSQASTTGSKHGHRLHHKESVRHRHLAMAVPPGAVRGGPAGVAGTGGPADLEVYCSVSNVSPDSGIYCVAGSPWHQSSPAHSPQHPPQHLVKGLPSPPRGTKSQDHRRKHVSLKVAPASSSKASPKKSSSHRDVRVPPIPSIDDSDDEASCSSLMLPAPARRGRGRPKKTPPVLEPCVPYSSKASMKHVYAAGRAHNKSRKQIHLKESESSDQSVERCDKILTYSKHRSRDVQVTSQGVQCDQSEFPQLELPASKKKKKNQACQSYQVKKSSSLLKPSGYDAQEKEKMHRKAGSLKNVCDRTKKTVDSYSHGHKPVSQSKKNSSNSSKIERTSHSKLDSTSRSCSQSSSSSKRRLPSGVEKKKKGRRRGHAATLAAAAAVLLSSSSTQAVKTDVSNSSSQVTATSNIRPVKAQRPVEKVLALPRALKPHKHKRHHRRKAHKRRQSLLDPQELEKLIADFQRSCCIARLQQPSRLSEGMRLPSIFRVKRIFKKRKGSERSKHSDRDSGPEPDNTNPPATPAPRDSRDKGSTGGKRRPKKSAVETPKGQRPEANNEQRLPLKKRHYHMSTAPNQQSGLAPPFSSPDVSSSAEEKRSNDDDSPTSSTSSKGSLISTGSQANRGNSTLTTLQVQNKAALSPGPPSTVNDVSPSPNVVPCSGKSVTPTASNGSSPRSLLGRNFVKGGMPSPSPSSASSEVVVVMPATSSSPYDFVPNEPSILSKADSSASFASVCGKSESLLARMSLPTVEKTYPPNASLAISCPNRVYGPSSPNSRHSPQGASPSPSTKTAVPTGSFKPVQSMGYSKPNTACSAAPKSVNPKVSSTPSASSTAVKSVADSSLVTKTVNNPVLPPSAAPSHPFPSHPFPSQPPHMAASLNPAAASASSSKSGARNSYDEAIEACINKYSSATVVPRSVITTPKKRHRMEMQGKPGGKGGGKEGEASVHSTTTTATNNSVKKPPPAPAPPPPLAPPPPTPLASLALPSPQAPQALSLPESLSGVFEPSSSALSEHYVVDVSLPATPVKSVIAGLSKLKGGGADVVAPADSFSLTSHNLRHKKNLLDLPCDGEVDSGVEDTTPAENGRPLARTATDTAPDSDVKSKIKPKSKVKKVFEDDNSSDSCPNVTSKAEGKTEGKAAAGSIDNSGSSSELKELRIHVEKLDSSDIPPPKGKDKPKQLKTSGAVPKRRRKCNRTGFPVKRKKKKKESSPDELKVDDDNDTQESFPESISDPAVKEVDDLTPTNDVSLGCPSSQTQQSQELVNKKANQGSALSDDCKLDDEAKPLKEELVDDDSTIAKKESQAVILKNEDCAKGIKLETSPSQHDDLTHVPYTDRLPNTEKYMFAGFTRRLDVKANAKVRKPSKAVIRAMRAKFSENLSLPDGPSMNKGSKAPNWSTDESDDSFDDPYEFSETLPPGPTDCEEVVKSDQSEEVIKPEPENSFLKSKTVPSRRRPKREMKRPALSPCDETVKSKIAKSEKDGSQIVPANVIKPSTSESRTRNKRKNDGEDMPTPGELRNTRHKKRLRTHHKTDVDSQDSDCDDACEPLPSTVVATSAASAPDPLSEDETTKKDAKQPRWRKKYLPAGLFSDYFKLDEPRPVADGKKSLQYKPEDHPHGLLPPPYHCGKWLRQRRVNFQLPYDLWWLHTHNKLPGRDIVPSWNYKKIRTNVYNNVKPSYVHEPQTCNCKMPEKDVTGCGDDCINRLVYSECSPSLCLLRERCANQKIQKHEWAPGLERFMTKEKGWGVRAKLPIKSGEFILEYVGEVVSDKEFKERMATIYTQDTHHYCLHLDGGLVIDGHRMGGDGRFVNHSCEPNCEMQKWSVNGLFRMALFALRDIDAHEELGYDYNFSLFNAAEGQPCKCGFSQCRGVIGGKSQRVNVLPSTQNGSSSKVSVKDISEKKGSRKSKRKANRKNDKEQATENMRQRKRIEAQRVSQLLTLNIRQMSHQQRCFVQEHHCFLLRNLEKVRKLKEKLKQACQRAEGYVQLAPTNVKQSDVFLTQLNALSIPRNVRTRRLAQAEDNPELARNARLACVLKDLYSVVVSAKDENGEALSAPFMTLPNKRKLPLYYVRIRDPLDFSAVEQNINSGLYCTLEAFDLDICKILNNNLKFYGRTTNLGIATVRLKKVYLDAKKEAHPQLVDVLGEGLPASFIDEKNPAEEEDVIRCICGLYRDEGMMIQCERCLVWQHCDCVKADSSFEHYLCEICQPRPIDLEIPMHPQPRDATEGQTEYVTLLRSDLQIRQGDTVYVLRDVTEGDSEAKVTYKTIKEPKYGDMDIFRIERLWKDEKGDRFAFGHHYLRPHETFHEPTRKFYPNEVTRVPIYEVISLDVIWAQCWVLDPMTYCKGRPIEAVEEHVYICEYRVDKSAHLFYKVSKSQSRANLCLKSYAFETFETKLKPVRTYTPHGTVSSLKPRVRGNQDDTSSTKSMQQSQSSVIGEEEEVPLARVRDSAMAEKREKQRSHLNGILLRLLGNQHCKQPLDMSYLLDPGRRPRKKPSSLNT